MKKEFQLNGKRVEVKKALPKASEGGGGGGRGRGGGRGGRGGGKSNQFCWDVFLPFYCILNLSKKKKKQNMKILRLEIIHFIQIHLGLFLYWDSS